MKLKNSELLSSVEALQSLAKKDLPVFKIGWPLTKNIKAIDAALAVFDELRKKIVEKYTDKKEDGTPVEVTDKDGKVLPGQVRISNTDAFSKEMQELMDCTSEVEIRKIKIQDFGDLQVEPRVFTTASFIFEE